MKKALTLALALVALATFSGTSNAARNPGSGIPVLPSGSALTVQVMGGSVACPPPAPAVINTSPWIPAGQKINCNATGGLDCSEANISAGTIVHLSTAPNHPSGSWSITGGPVTPAPNTCGYSAPNVGHTECEFTMPQNNLNVRVELPCPPPQVTDCTRDITNGVLTIPTPAVSTITSTSAYLSGTVTVMPIPAGCTYQAKLVWGPPNWNLATGLNATGSAPPNTIPLSGTASPLNPGSAYGARIEVKKQCLGLAPTFCNGPTKAFETLKGEKAHICVLKFEDKNGNGVQDTGELTLPGWTFQIKDASGNTVATIITGGPQQPCADVPAPGTYTVTEQPILNGWTPTTPNPQTVTASPGQTVNLSFGNKKKKEALPCTITITKKSSPFGGTGFSFNSAWSGLQGITLNDGQSISKTVACGPIFNVFETPKPGWVLTNIGCNISGGTGSFTIIGANPNPLFQPGDNEVNFSSLTPGANLQCTFINKEKPNISDTPQSPCKDVTIKLSTGQNPNWTVSPGTVGITSPLIGVWVNPVLPVSWIQPVSLPTPQKLSEGDYLYKVPFTLNSPAQYSSITVSGRYAADNAVSAGVSINGGTSVAPCAGPDCFSTWHQFAITSGFLNNNTLDVNVHNDPISTSPTYTGLVVDAELRAVCESM